MKNLLSFTFFLFLSALLHAQLIIDNAQSVQHYVQNVFAGSGMEVLNVTTFGVNTNSIHPSIGSFQCPECAVNLPFGIAISTGDVEQLIGPNNGVGNGMTTGLSYADPDIFSLAIANGAMDVSDITGFQFDFVATSDSLKLKYVWGSEEYDAYINTAFNDVFGIFLSGPGINGTYTNSAVNLALVPGTNMPVSVNTINNGYGNEGPCMNCEYFTQYQDDAYHSTFPFDQTFLSTYYTQLDGWTVPLEAKSPLICGQVYHLKIVICDSSDGILDSAVFLQGDWGQSTTESEVSANFFPGGQHGNTLFEDCGSGELVVSRPTAASSADDMVVYLNVNGTATGGDDYAALPDSVIIPSGMMSVNIALSAIQDGLVEGDETLNITSTITACTGDTITNVWNFMISDTASELIVEDGSVTLCVNDTELLDLNVTGGYGSYQYAWSNGATTSSIEVLADAPVQSFVLTVTDGCGLTASGELSVAQVIVNPHTVSLTSNFEYPLTCNEMASATWNVTGGVAPYYSVLRTSDNIQASFGTSNTAMIGSYNAPYVYLVSQDHCSNLAYDTLWIDFEPPALFVNAPDTIDFECGASIDVALDIVGGFTYDGEYNISWQLGGTYISTNSNQSDIIITNLTSSSYLNAYVSDFCGNNESVGIYLNIDYPLDGIGPCNGPGGCMDNSACNYSPTATEDDGSCYYTPIGHNISGPLVANHGAVETYTYPSTNQNTTFVWTVQGGNILSGQGTNEITVEWSLGFGYIHLIEYADESCPGPPTSINVLINLGPNQIQILLETNPSSGGAVSGADIYTIGEQVVITATPSDDFSFAYWLLDDGTQIFESNYTFTANQSESIVAHFEPIIYYYTLTVNSNNTSLGSVTEGGVFLNGSYYTITATAEAGAYFVQWETADNPGYAVSYNDIFELQINQDLNLVAIFDVIAIFYNLNLYAEPTDAAQTYGWGGYLPGETAELYFIPYEGFDFVGWMVDGILVSNEPTYSLQMDSDHDVIALFQPNDDLYTISLSHTPLEGGSTFGAGDYTYGDIATIWAANNEGFVFVGWMENDQWLTTDFDLTFEVDQDRTLIAVFDPVVPEYVVLAEANPTIGGYTIGYGLYPIGTEVTLTAVPALGYQFVEWTLDGVSVGTSLDYSLVVSNDVLLVAHFEEILPSYIVSLAADPSIGGVVFGAGTFSSSTLIAVEAISNPGYYFMHWMEDGEIVSTASFYAFDITSNRTLTAVFALTLVSWNLELSAQPVDGGTVTGFGSYDAGALVSAMASPSAGYAFINWTANGVEVSTESTYIFTIESDVVLQANFMEVSVYSITVGVDPIAGGTILGAGEYLEGAAVDLEAIPNINYIFLDWSSNGNVLSTEPVYSFVVEEDMDIVARFELIDAVSEQELNEIYHVYPNPSNGDLTVQCKTAMHLTVYDVTGALVINQSSSKLHSVHIQTPGLYWVHVYTDNLHVSQYTKIIVR